MAETTPPAGDRTGRVLRIALVLSLTANLVILGLILGAAFGRGGGGPRGGDPALAALGFNPYIAALPRSDRAALGMAMVGRAGDLRQNRDELRRQFDALLAALRAEPFDIAAVRDAVTGQQAQLRQVQDIGRDLLFERIAAMTPAERADYAAALESAVHRGPRGPFRDH
jgi:hypothetical protein